MNFFIKNRVIYYYIIFVLAYAAEFRAVTEEFSVEFRQEPPQPYGQLPQEGVQKAGNSLMLQYCAN